MATVFSPPNSVHVVTLPRNSFRFHPTIYHRKRKPIAKLDLQSSTSARQPSGFPTGPLPYPAAKVVIGQYLACDQGEDPYWGWLVVAAFYDSNDAKLWATEIFIIQTGDDLEELN